MINNIDLATLTTTQGIKIYGAASYDYSGESVSIIGDINGDGFRDFLVSSKFVEPLGRARTGETYLIFGKSTSWTDIDLKFLNITQGIKILGVEDEYSGFSVSGVGDVNKDGYADFLIGAYNARPLGRNQAGISYLIFGKDINWVDIDLKNFTIMHGIKIQGATGFEFSGWHVSGAGDVNGDGYDDIIIGSPGGLVIGKTYLIFGKSVWTDIDLSIITHSQGIKFQGITANDKTGDYVSGAGDVNGDGYSDFLIGAYKASPLSRNQAGVSYLIFGKATGWTNIDLGNLTASQGIKIQGAISNDQSGYSVSGVGDVNKDGYADFLVGVRYADPLGRTGAGAVYLIFGKATGWINIDLGNLTTLQGIEISGAASGDFIGHDVGGIGDVDKDGYDDFLISSKIGGYMIFGHQTNWTNIDLNNAAPNIIKILTTGGFLKFGGSGDINNNGYNDILISNSVASPFGRTYAGESYLIFGNVFASISTAMPTALTMIPTAITMSPTIEPTTITISPTINPIINSTIITMNPSLNPIIVPTENPTIDQRGNTDLAIPKDISIGTMFVIGAITVIHDLVCG